MKQVLNGLFFILIGYYFIGKPWGYTFIGEAFLVFSSLVFFLFLFVKKKIQKGIPAALYILLLYGGFALVMGLSTYKIDAIRDSVIIVYSVYAIIIYHAFHHLKLYPSIWVNKSLIVFKIVPFAFLLLIVTGGIEDVIYVKAGDMGVHLSFIAISFLLGLIDFRNRFLKIAAIICIVVIFSWLAAYNRGGALSVMCAFFLALILKGRFKYIKRMIVFGGLLVLMVFLIDKISFSKKENFQGRSFSSEQILKNFDSILKTVSNANLSSLRLGERDTEDDPTSANILWRLIWWVKIIDYTILGDYFWFGKGMGINLAVDDGITDGDTGLRSPHNIHMTFLARLGIIGFSLWMIFLLKIARRCISAIRGFKKMGRTKQEDLLILTFSYWVAFLVNASFDVFLEGPMGGIPFWTLTGLILYQLNEHKRFLKNPGTVEKRKILTSES